MRPRFLLIGAALFISCAAFAAPPEGHLWAFTIKMPAMPAMQKPVEGRICQKPAGEYEMPDLGQMPADCTKSPLRRNGQQTTVDYTCKGVAGSFVANWTDPEHFEGVSTLKMRGNAPPMKIEISARRDGSCQLPVTTGK